MILNPFEVPRGIRVTQTPTARKRPVYTQYHPVPMMVDQHGIRIEATDGILTESGSVWPLETALLPSRLREVIYSIRRRRAAAKLGSAIVRAH